MSSNTWKTLTDHVDKVTARDTSNGTRVLLNTPDRLNCMKKAVKYWKDVGVAIVDGNPVVDELYVRVGVPLHWMGFVYEPGTDELTIIDSSPTLTAVHHRSGCDGIYDECKKKLEFALGRRVDPNTTPKASIGNQPEVVAKRPKQCRDMVTSMQEKLRAEHPRITGLSEVYKLADGAV